MFNSVQNYLTLKLTRRVYAARPQEVTALSSRTFGTWTLLSAIVRGYCAYYVTNPQVYDLTLWSYLIAGGHFISEWVVFGSARYVCGGGGCGGQRLTRARQLWQGTGGPPDCQHHERGVDAGAARALHRRRVGRHWRRCWVVGGARAEIPRREWPAAGAGSRSTENKLASYVHTCSSTCELGWIHRPHGSTPRNLPSTRNLLVCVLISLGGF